MTEPADAAQSAEPPGSLRDQAIESGRWVAVGRVLMEVTAFAGMLVLARLLTPAEVGLAALPLVALALAGGFLSGSFGSPLIRSQTLDPREVEVATLMSLLAGLLLSGGCLLLSFALDGPLDPRIAELVALASPCFLLSAIAVVPQALRTRRLAFRSLVRIEIAAAAAGTATSVVLAALGVSSAALIIGGLAAMAVTAVLSIPGSGARLPGWHRSEAGEILRFGVPASLSSVFYTLARNVDYALLSARLPPAEVGLYYRAYTLAVNYQLKFSGIVVRILFPLLSRTQSKDFAAVRGRVIRLNTVVLFPFLALLASTAPEAIPLLLGDDWREAVLPTQILAAGGIGMTLGAGIGPVMLAAGYPRAMLINNIVAFAGFAVTVWICAGYGLTVTCIGVAAYHVLAAAVSQWALASRLLGIPLRKTLIEDPGPAAASALALLAVAMPLVELLADLGSPAVLTVAAASIAGLVTYVAVLRTVFRGAWDDLQMVGLGMLPGRLRRLSGALRRRRG